VYRIVAPLVLHEIVTFTEPLKVYGAPGLNVGVATVACAAWTVISRPRQSRWTAGGAEALTLITTRDSSPHHVVNFLTLIIHFLSRKNDRGHMKRSIWSPYSGLDPFEPVLLPDLIDMEISKERVNGVGLVP
jgi:hypothetical protein